MTTSILVSRQITNFVQKRWHINSQQPIWSIGFLAPVFIIGRHILRQIVSDTLNWDDPLTEPLKSQWNPWKSSLQALENIHIPRVITPCEEGTTDFLWCLRKGNRSCIIHEDNLWGRIPTSRICVRKAETCTYIRSHNSTTWIICSRFSGWNSSSSSRTY